MLNARLSNLFAGPLVGVALAFMVMVGAAHAQATRTWVSGVGDDANPCSRTAPCKTFAGAISKTATGGEISVLDPGGFGAVTITKSISIIAEGAEGGILAAGGVNGVIINASSTSTVRLKGLVIEGAGTGLNGVRVLQARNVSIEDCLIRNFTGNGVVVEPGAAIARVVIADTMIEKNNNGVVLKPTAAISARVELDRVHSMFNMNVGLLSDGTSVARINDSVITFNGTGLSAVNGGGIVSFGNNAIENNNVNGAPTSTVALQ